MADYGDSGYGYIISTTISTGTPSGDKIFILPKSSSRNTRSLQRKHNLRNGYSRKLESGKRNINVDISDGLILASNINNVIAILDASIVGTQIYFWKKITASTYEQFRDPTGTYKDYLYGWIENYTIKDFSDKYRKISITITDGWDV